MDIQQRRAWIIAIIGGALGTFLAQALGIIVPSVVGWYITAGWPIDAGLGIALILLLTGLTWGLEPAKQALGGYSVRRHVGFALASLFFTIFSGELEPLLDWWDGRRRGKLWLSLGRTNAIRRRLYSLWAG